MLLRQGGALASCAHGARVMESMLHEGSPLMGPLPCMLELAAGTAHVLAPPLLHLCSGGAGQLRAHGLPGQTDELQNVAVSYGSSLNSHALQNA